MDGRYGHDDQEKVEMDVYRGYGNNSSFEHPQPYAPYSPLPRPLTPVRPGHFPVDEYGQHVSASARHAHVWKLGLAPKHTLGLTNTV